MESLFEGCVSRALCYSASPYLPPSRFDRPCPATHNAAFRLVSASPGFTSSCSGAIKVAESLRTNTALRKLVLYECDIGEKGGLDLADALEVNTTLKEFDYCGNAIGGVANRKLRDVRSGLSPIHAARGYSHRGNLHTMQGINAPYQPQSPS